MTLSQYVSYFRANAARMPKEHRFLADMVVRNQEELDDILQQRGRGMTETEREDLLQSALLLMVEAVRQAEATGVQLDAAWEKRAMTRVSSVLAERAAHRSESEEPMANPHGEGN